MARFKVGDTVTIRQWDDMEKEYGLNSDGNIKVPGLFTHTMRHYCGKQYTVVEDVGAWYKLRGEGYSFSDGMFEESKIASPVSIDTPPKYWVVKRDESNPLFKKCIDYLNETCGSTWSGSGDFYEYYGFDGKSSYDEFEAFKNSPKLITLEEWDKWFGGKVLEPTTTEKSVPPKYWVVKKDESNPIFKKCIKYINERAGTEWKSLWKHYGFDGGQYSYSGYNCWDNIRKFENNPKLITLEEWDKWFGSEEGTQSSVATSITCVCSDIGTTLTQEKLQNVIDKLGGYPVSTTIPQKTATSYIELCDLYKKLRGSGPTEAEEEPTSIFTFKKLK